MRTIRKWVSHLRWVSAQTFGYVLGFPVLARFHRVVLLCTLHALGYGNNHNPRYTGEEWLIRNVIAKEGIRGCFDVGANVGNYSIMLKEHVEGPIYAIEPIQTSFDALEKIADDRIFVYRYAVSDSDGEVTMHTTKDEWEGATIHSEVLDVDSVEERVPGITLDSFVEKHGITEAGFVKIDTEGHEMEVLRGMQGMLKKLKPAYIQFEYGGQHMRRGHSLYLLAKELPGYELYRLLPHGLLKVDPGNYAHNVFMYSNIVAKRKG